MYLWPVVIVWLLDRIARLIKLLLCNLYLQKNGAQMLSSKGTVFYDKTTNLIRLQVTLGAAKLLPKAGQFYYIYQPLAWRGYESHPFTAASWARAPSDQKDFLHEDIHSSASRVAQHELVFWIRPFSGWTRRLKAECLRSENLKVESTFLIEGPYGKAVSLHAYENVVLIAGGAGFAGVWPHLEEYMSRSYTSITPPRNQDNSDVEMARVQNITLILASRQQLFYGALITDETACLLSRLGVKMEFYCTTDSGQPLHAQPKPDESTYLLGAQGGSYGHQSSISTLIKPGRPDIRKSINRILYDAQESDCATARTAIVVCGPAAMADETRAAVRDALKNGHSRIEYFEEAFNW